MHYISISNCEWVRGLQLCMLAILIMDLYAHEYEGKKKNMS